MAAFTTMALIGMAGAAGMFAGKKLAPKPTGAGATATSPTPTPTPPPSTAVAGSANTATAQAAARKTRRRMATVGSTPSSTPGQSLITPTTAPKTALGY